MKLACLGLTVMAFVGVDAATPAVAAPIHDYEFTAGVTDSVAGGVALQPSNRGSATGTVSGGSYNFQQGAGLSLSDQLPGASYTIDLRTSFDNVDGYRKLVSFNDLSSDNGLYILNGGLTLFGSSGSGPAGVVAAGSPFDVRLTRNGTDGLMTGFLNGIQQFTYTDTNNLFLATSNLFFLRDDTDQNREDSAGSADFIRIADGSPDAPVVAAVPEPATWSMMILGFGAVGLGMRRRARVVMRASHAA